MHNNNNNIICCACVLNLIPSMIDLFGIKNCLHYMIATSDPLPPYKYSSLPLGIVHVTKLIKSVLSITKAHSIYTSGVHL